MASDETETPTVPVVCPDCDTTTRVALPDVREALERHNDRLHDGEEVASVDPVLVAELTDLVADDLQLLDDE